MDCSAPIESFDAAASDGDDIFGLQPMRDLWLAVRLDSE